MIGGNRVGPRIGAFSATAAAILAFGSMAVACAPTHVVSSSDSLAKRVAQLESRQEKLVDELASLRRRVGGLTRTDAPLATGTLFGIDALPSLGTASRWVLIEYSDFQCPFCQRHFADTFPEIQRDYVQTGKLRYVFHNRPIASLHPDAVSAAQAGVCAQRQGRFWDLHRVLFSNPDSLTAAALLGHAREIGLDIAAYLACMSADGPGTVQGQIRNAESLGIQGTPAFLIGELGTDGTVTVRGRVQGAQPYDAFRRILDQLIAGT